jgi:hypothetical protein
LHIPFVYAAKLIKPNQPGKENTLGLRDRSMELDKRDWKSKRPHPQFLRHKLPVNDIKVYNPGCGGRPGPTSVWHLSGTSSAEI